VYADRFDLRLFFFCIVAAGIILESIIPRRVPFVAPRHRRTLFKRLFRRIDSSK
jgi:hypothetical protein